MTESYMAAKWMYNELYCDFKFGMAIGQDPPVLEEISDVEELLKCISEETFKYDVLCDLQVDKKIRREAANFLSELYMKYKALTNKKWIPSADVRHLQKSMMKRFYDAIEYSRDFLDDVQLSAA